MLQPRSWGQPFSSPSEYLSKPFLGFLPKCLSPVVREGLHDHHHPLAAGPRHHARLWLPLRGRCQVPLGPNTWAKSLWIWWVLSPCTWGWRIPLLWGIRDRQHYQVITALRCVCGSKSPKAQELPKSKVPILRTEVRNCPWSFPEVKFTSGIDMDELGSGLLLSRRCTALDG